MHDYLNIEVKTSYAAMCWLAGLSVLVAISAIVLKGWSLMLR
jgi:hypothetical protein